MTDRKTYVATLSNAPKHFGVARSTISKWLAEGKLSKFKVVVDGRRRYVVTLPNALDCSSSGQNTPYQAT